jgi:mannosyltransferase OCH1-like enzyme
MAYINHRIKAIFLHNVKCGGCYIREILMKYYGFELLFIEEHNKLQLFIDNPSDKDKLDKYGHNIKKMGKYRYLQTHQDGYNKILDEYFVFSFVRNPYEKIYSAYSYLKKNLLSDGKINNCDDNIDFYYNFSTFVKNKDNVCNTSFFHAFITNCEQFYDLNNNIKINYIGKFENLEIELIKILKILGFKNLKHTEYIFDNIKKNNSKIPGYMFFDDFNEESFLLINEYFKNDFDVFEYYKCSTLEEFKNSYREKNNPPGYIDNKISQTWLDLFLTIPTDIEPKVKPILQNIIPKIIIQTYKTNIIHPHIYNNIMNMLNKNKEYRYIFITDDIGKKLINENFDKRTQDAFSKLKIGAAKGDFLRYIALYLYGGVYLDLDASIEIDLDSFIQNTTDYIMFYTPECGVITQWIAMFKPKHIIIKKIIEEMVKRILDGETRIYIATGPDLFTDVLYELFTEEYMYDIVSTLSKYERMTFIEKIKTSNKLGNGLIFDTYDMIKIKKWFLFHMRNYNDGMIYVDELHYLPNDNIFEECTIKKKYSSNDLIEEEEKEETKEELLLINLHKKIELIKHFNKLQEEFISKYEEITKLLLKTIEKNSNNIIKTEFKQIKKIITDLNIENTNGRIKNEKNIGFIESHIFKSVNESIGSRYVCDKCNFVSVNKLANYAHSFFCK